MALLFLAFTEHVRSVSFVSSPREGFLRALLLCKGVVINVGASPIAFAVQRYPSPRPGLFFFKTRSVLSLLLHIREISTTSNGGPLGSCIDEERSKLRYVV